MRTGTLFGLLAGGGVAILAGSAQATLIQYQFSGAVYAIVDDEHELDEIVHLGDVCIAAWVFDITSPDSDPLAYRGTYEAVSSLLTLSSSPYSVSTNGLLEVYDASQSPSTADRLSFYAPNSGIVSFLVSLSDADDEALSSDALPLQIQLSDFSERFIGVWMHPGDAKFYASVDSVVVTAVPEPGTLILALLGLLGAGKGAARRF